MKNAAQKQTYDVDPVILEKFRVRMRARSAEIKDAMLAWLQSREDVGDTVCITNALLEIALERHVAVHDANGFDLIEAAYKRAVDKGRGPLQ